MARNGLLRVDISDRRCGDTSCAPFPCRAGVLIRRDGGRSPVSHSARDYVRAFDLTCIALWRDGERWRLVDGTHRLAAMKAEGAREVECAEFKRSSAFRPSELGRQASLLDRARLLTR
jgi:hypothetical protein